MCDFTKDGRNRLQNVNASDGQYSNERPRASVKTAWENARALPTGGSRLRRRAPSENVQKQGNGLLPKTTVLQSTAAKGTRNISEHPGTSKNNNNYEKNM